ncbi:hypothetical protein ABT294_00815 [Nonomuraea sp. NPDC000554]|uniref:hypothetical protein n=1 Tax=Nonomuraea sp. NPDC000554 TaxID=3154259 RepID=UPI003323ABE4
MSEITPEKVAAAVCERRDGWRESLESALSLTAEGHVLSLTLTRWDGEGDAETVRHFRAVVVEGTEAPIVLEPPAELGIQWHDGGDLLALTRDGITIFPHGADEWSMSPDNARELAAHLAAMADAYEAAQAQRNGGAS